MTGLVSVAEMRALEQAAFATGVSEAALQERAGTAVAEEIAHLLPPGGRVAALIGRGNNGRDGMVAARWLARRGTPVQVVLAPRHAVTEAELAELRSLGVAVLAPEDVDESLANIDVAVDALLGIGATGSPREPLASLARAMNTANVMRVALDLPSGIDADTGQVEGDAVRADVTVTLGAVKQGLLRFPAAEYVGRLIVRDIGLADAALPFQCLQVEDLRGLVPSRPLQAHKYRFGRVLVLAGSDHFVGAAVLCTGGALRAGAGLATIHSTAAVRSVVAGRLPEATYTQEGTELASYVKSHNALVIGPGLGRTLETQELVREVLRVQREGATVVDADALYALSETADWPRLVGPRTVLTPHSGELARLVGHDLDERSTPLWVTAQGLARQWQCVLIAKGPFTAVAAPDGRVAVWPHANAALATGGTGDVLAGLCGGLLAQGLSAFDAARLAVGVHALAARRVIDSRGWRTLLASDLLEEIPAVLGELSRRPT